MHTAARLAVEDINICTPGTRKGPRNCQDQTKACDLIDLLIALKDFFTQFQRKSRTGIGQLGDTASGFSRLDGNQELAIGRAKFAGVFHQEQSARLDP